MAHCVLIISTHFATTLAVASTIDYSHWKHLGLDFNRPGEWPGKCHQGNKQSPININANMAVKEDDVQPFIFHGYDRRGYTSLINNGHTIKFEIDKGRHELPWIQGGGLDNFEYQFEQGHFHWGLHNDKGSEHHFYNQPAPMELHLVHFNRHLYKDFDDAIRLPSVGNSIVNLAVIYKIGRPNIKLDVIFKALREKEFSVHAHALPEGIKLIDFLPENTREFYRYDGSMTTPGCSEISSWTIFKHQVEIAQAQMEILRKIEYIENNNKSTLLGSNSRSIQNTNQRTVRFITTRNVSSSKNKLNLRNKYALGIIFLLRSVN